MRLNVALSVVLVSSVLAIQVYALDIVEEIKCQELLETLEKNADKKDSDKMATLLFNAASIFSGRIIIPTGFHGDLKQEEEKLLKLKLKDCGIEVEP